MAEGYQVRLILIDAERKIDLPGDSHNKLALEQRIKVLVQKRWWNKRLGTVGKILGMAVGYNRLRTFVQAEQLTLVISFLERANILNLMAVDGVPRIISVRKHIEKALEQKPWFKALLVRLAYQALLFRATVVVCNSCESAGSFANIFPASTSRVRTILNSVSKATVLSAIRPNRHIEDTQRQLHVVAMGRYRPAKGFVPLIRAFAKVCQHCPNTSLTIIGDGPERSKLEHMIAALDLAERVQLAGFQKNPFEQVARADLYVLTSRAEGFPNALLEAMALGVPVIAADCPSGPREILAPSSDPTRKTSTLEKAEYGLLIPSLTQRDLEPGTSLDATEQVLADSIIEMIQDERLRAEYADLAQRRALEFTPERMISEWQALITEVSSPSSVKVANYSDSGERIR